IRDFFILTILKPSFFTGKEADRKNKALKLEISVLKNRLQESEEQYAYLLGRYQEDVGNKIIHF
ncbi:MAG: hypothetical protein II581_06550, partial [Oscillospiraceae bacterium]|nr:hypothetical protein [Oscillospiraceae bacterium]